MTVDSEPRARRTALVLGGSAGIGLGTAKRLLDFGVETHIVGRNPETLRQALTEASGLIGHQLDAGDRAELKALGETFDVVDYLVLSHGVGGGSGPVATLDLDAVKRAMDGRVYPYLLAIQVLLPKIASTGSIAMIGGASARMGMAGTAGLAAVNGAVEAMVKALAVELAPIRVVVVSPGITNTRAWGRLPDAQREEFFARAAEVLPARRVAAPEDIGDAVAMAAMSPYITGTVIEATGGAVLVSIP